MAELSIALRNLMIAYTFNGDHERALALLKIDPTIEGRKRAIIQGYANWRLVHSR